MPKGQTKTLSYPQNATSGDYIAFGHVKYSSNRSSRGKKGTPPPNMGSDIILYMPTTTPAMGNQNNWASMNPAPGALGVAQLNAAEQIGQNFEGGVGESVEQGVEAFKNIISNAREGIRGIAYQGAMNLGAGLLMMSPNAVTQLGQGKIFNPNTELAYNGPQLRQYSFQFDFIPRNDLEARTVDEIIMEFKKWSAPSDTGDNMYEVPELWSVTYVSGGQVNRMNRFKMSALANVTIKHNPSSDLHVTYTDGTPVATSMKLDFQETDVIIREDHEKAGGQGF